MRRSSNKQTPVIKAQPPKENEITIPGEEYSQQQPQQQQQQAPQQPPHQHQQQPQPPQTQVQQQTTKNMPQQYVEQAQGTLQWRHAREIYHGVMHSNPEQMVIYSMSPVNQIQEAPPPHTTAAQQHVIQTAEYPTDVSFAVNIVSQ